MEGEDKFERIRKFVLIYGIEIYNALSQETKQSIITGNLKIKDIHITISPNGEFTHHVKNKIK